MMKKSMKTQTIIARRARVYGIVQGVGFRPTVSRHASRFGVVGSVCNKGPYVELFAQGTAEQVNEFLYAVEHQPPQRAAVLKVDVKPTALLTCDTFSIIESEKTKGEIFISPDIATCESCQKELFHPSDKRYLHPFINCTCCGPRLTILDSLPYDRERTSMREFPMCPSCAEEYHSPSSRRYDAQPVCCNDCGPEVYLIDRPERGRDAILYARKAILEGQILAIKGIGGFHLCCDAGNEQAVQRLRQRKHRPKKPFAVMMRDLDTVKQSCEVTAEQCELLTGHQKPIILLKRQKGDSSIAASVAPDNPKLGVMLPYAPVQMLLFDYDDGLQMPHCLVMTSGNVSGAPICRDDADAIKELSAFTDCILSHNRKIRIRADDSVMDFFEQKPYMIRRSRGYAPLPFLLSQPQKGCVLAIGGELKNTFCIAVNGLYYPSPFVGDLADLRTVNALKETIERFQTLLEVQPQAVVCDLHPKYNSTAAAKQLHLPVIQVQHHYAHILSCMVENDCLEPVIGVSFDGTGYGTDGTIWGGEILAADPKGFTRLGSIQPFLQIGGDASAREGWRIAVSMLYSLTKDKMQTLDLVQRLSLCDSQTAKFQLMMYDRKLNAVQSTSAGRLFDAVSALLGICKCSSFEGEASTALQFAAEAWEQSSGTTAAWDVPPCHIQNGHVYLATDKLVESLLKGILSGTNPSQLAYQFHDILSAQIVQACELVRSQTGRSLVALSGGCFQNLLLLRLTTNRLRTLNFRVLLHSLTPPNDGGLALGQALYGLSGRCPEPCPSGTSFP